MTTIKIHFNNDYGYYDEDETKMNAVIQQVEELLMKKIYGKDS